MNFVSAISRKYYDVFLLFFHRCLKPELDGEIFELLFSLSDFLTFKEIMIDYKTYKERLSQHGNFEIFVTPITGIIED